MSRLILVLLCGVSIGLLHSCKEDASEKYAYAIKIHKPDAEDKKMGEMMHLHIDFESQTEETIHHVNVRIYNKATKEEVYSAPADGHVHGEGKFEHHDDFELNADNQVAGHNDYVLEAKVWAHDEGEAEVVKMLEFHVHP